MSICFASAAFADAATVEEVRIRTDLVNHCSQRFLVLDHSKFGRGATVRAGHITDADCVFTDKPSPPAIVDMLDSTGVKFVISSADAHLPS